MTGDSIDDLVAFTAFTVFGVGVLTSYFWLLATVWKIWEAVKPNEEDEA